MGARNSSGTHSLASGNPVVTGTTISSTTYNNTLSDISSELTNSLDRNGRGAMAAPLQLSNGTASLPSLTFGSETASGIYRAGTQDVRIQINTSQIQRWLASSTVLVSNLTVTSTSATLGTGPLTVSTGGVVLTAGNLTLTAGNATLTSGNLTLTNGAFAITSGNATLTSGNLAITSGNITLSSGIVTVQGTAGAVAIQGTGGSSDGTGVKGIGGTTVGAGIHGLSNGAGTGGYFQSTSGNAIEVTAPIYVNFASNPAATTGFTNKITPLYVPKAWAVITTGAGSATLAEGFNVNATVTCTGNVIDVLIEDDLASANYVVTGEADIAAGATENISIGFHSHAAGGFSFTVFDASNLRVATPCNTSYTFRITVMGQQGS
jgi:hypothetical protein